MQFSSKKHLFIEERIIKRYYKLEKDVVSVIAMMISAIENDYQREYMAEIYERYYPSMLKKAKLYVQGEEEAEELVQEVFMKLIERVDSVMTVERKKLASYLFSAVKFTAFNQYRKQKTRSKYMTFVDSDQEDLELLRDENALPEELFIRKETVEELGAALEKIPEKYKNVLEYKYILGLSDGEIAEKLGGSEQSVRSCLTRARRKAYSVLKGGE